MNFENFYIMADFSSLENNMDSKQINPIMNGMLTELESMDNATFGGMVMTRFKGILLRSSFFDLIIAKGKGEGEYSTG